MAEQRPEAKLCARARPGLRTDRFCGEETKHDERGKRASESEQSGEAETEEVEGGVEERVWEALCRGDGTLLERYVRAVHQKFRQMHQYLLLFCSEQGWKSNSQPSAFLERVSQ